MSIAIGLLEHQINSLEKVLELKQNFQVKVVTGKTLFFIKGPFVLTIPDSILC